MADLITFTIDEKRALTVGEQLGADRAAVMVHDLQLLVERFRADVEEVFGKYEDEARAAGGNVVPFRRRG